VEEAERSIRLHESNGAPLPAEIAAGLPAWVQAEQARRMQIDAWFEAWAAAQMPLQGEDETQPDPDGLLLDLGQFVLDIAGIIGPSPLCDGVKAIISLVRLDFLGAGCSALGILAFAGDFAKLGKLPKYIESAFQALRLAAKTPDFAAKVAPLVRAIKNLLDKLPLEKLPKQISGRLVELRDGIAEFLASEGALRVVGKYLQSAHHVLADPQLLPGRTLAEVRAAIGHSLGWVHDVMRHGTSHPGGGWVFREVDGAGNFTGRPIQCHPAGRHFDCRPYWKVSGVPDHPQFELPHSTRSNDYDSGTTIAIRN